MSAGHPIDEGQSAKRPSLPASSPMGLARSAASWRSFSVPRVDAPPYGAASERPLSRLVKRALDVLLSVAALVITAPIVLLLMVIIRLDSPGPVLFRQIRIGRGGVPFELFKLRTMFAGQGVHATRIGRFLRPMGLDELPQFVNVLIGQMSIVGPRPERPHLVDEYIRTYPGYALRHVIRPGITGWAQIHGHRGGGSIAERLRRDMEYVRTWSPLGDLWILALSVFAVCRDTRRELGW